MKVSINISIWDEAVLGEQFEPMKLHKMLAVLPKDRAFRISQINYEAHKHSPSYCDPNWKISVNLAEHLVRLGVFEIEGSDYDLYSLGVHYDKFMNILDKLIDFEIHNDLPSIKGLEPSTNIISFNSLWS